MVQSWDCQGCSNCCREYRVFLNDAEVLRLEEQDWSETDLADTPRVVHDRSGTRLNQRVDASCVFLSEQGRCRIHERFGPEAKPFACRLYPFVLVPAGDHWRVSLRYACPSAARNEGRPLREHEAALREFALELERIERSTGRDPKHGKKLLAAGPPALQGRQVVDWPDLFAFQKKLLSILQDRKDRLERRWRRCLALVSLCRMARFEQVKGDRLNEFLDLVSTSLDGDVPTDPILVPKPSWVGRVLFRQAAALLARTDVGPERGIAMQGRLALLRAAWRFALGTGQVPRVHAAMPETTFERIEEPAAPLSAAAEAALERYYTVKVGSLQFCGPTNFDMHFWSGLQSLALTMPVILWLTRALSHLQQNEAVTRAIGIVDGNFGYSPLLGSRRQRFSLGILADRGELEKLIAWYSRAQVESLPETPVCQ